MLTEYVPGKATQEYRERMSKRMHVDSDYIVITIADDYDIPLEKCNTYEGILSWVLQLSEKTWIEREDLRYFIKLACEANKISVPYN